MRRVENSTNQLNDASGLASTFVLFRLRLRLYNFMCSGFQSLWD